MVLVSLICSSKKYYRKPQLRKTIVMVVLLVAIVKQESNESLSFSSLVNGWSVIDRLTIGQSEIIYTPST